MAASLGIAATGLQLLDTTITICKHIINAYKQQKQLVSVLEKYAHDLGRIRDLATEIRNEKALEGAQISDPLARLKGLEDKLQDWLAKVDPGDKNSLRRFADQLVRGQDDRRKLDVIMKDVDQVKDDLKWVIRMHEIRVTHKISQDVVSKSSREHIVRVRRVNRNVAKRGATMVNASLGGVDLWGDMDVVEIEDNICEEDAEMFNYRNDESGIKLARENKRANMAERRKQIEWEIAKEREQMLWQRDNGFLP